MAEYQKHPILLVDDEPEILFSLRGLLRHDFEVFTAESAVAALEILQARPIHIVMTDQRMPEITGSELMGRVKNHWPRTIRVVFTGYADIKAVMEAINTGGLYRYITKPWDPDELVEMLKEAGCMYNELVERQQLLTALESHLAANQQLAARLPHLTPDDTQRLLAEGGPLLEQVRQAILREV